VRLEVSAKDQGGRELFSETRRYLQIGLDTEGYMRYGAWQIREYQDLSLQPRETRKERFLMHFKKDTSRAEVSVKVLYCLSGKECGTVHEETVALQYR